MRKAVEMIFNSEVPLEDKVIEVLEEMAVVSEEVYQLGLNADNETTN